MWRSNGYIEADGHKHVKQTHSLTHIHSPYTLKERVIPNHLFLFCVTRTIHKHNAYRHIIYIYIFWVVKASHSVGLRVLLLTGDFWVVVDVV